MNLILEKNQALSPKKSHERLYLAIFFTLHIILLYQLAQSSNQADCSPRSHKPHVQTRQTRSRQERLGDFDDDQGERPRGEDYTHNHNYNSNHHRHHDHHASRKQRRLRDRAVYMAYENSRINSSESLASSWFYQQDQPSILEQCCACDEAKYELVFEGLWSKYTHPDDFPENYWLAYFSDIIGASHSNDFQMWSQDSLASDGVRELAETGATKKLESELKQVSSKTRTIIKARELRYPTLNSKTSAVFRTDKNHHLVSILSKLGPSPDWMVGVSSLELCQVDCTWAAQRVVNLYLWDAGTDSGTSFMSQDSPTRPQERIHPYRRSVDGTSNGVTSSLINAAGSGPNPGSGSLYFEQPRNQRLLGGQQSGAEQLMMLPPLIDDSSATILGSNNNYQQQTASMQQQQQQDQMKPFARLTVTRQRIYEKSCNAATSGESMSTYSRPSSYNQLTQHQQQQQQHQSSHVHPTFNSDSLLEPTRASYSDCRFTDWSDWSSCSSTCGKGIRTRTRSFYDDQAHLTAGCSQSDLIEKEICLADCVGNASCITHDWSEWSKCSVGCGQGYRKRTRSPIGSYKAACASIELAEMEQCTGGCSGQDAADDQAPSSQLCGVTEWSQWSECSVACGKGTKIRTRQFVRKEDLENCNNVKLLQKQSCNGKPELCKQVATKSIATQTGQSTYNHHQQHQNQTRNNFYLPVIDCKLSNWSPWSTCSALCGSGKRTRSRYIIQMPQNGGKPCDKKLSRTQKCKDLPQCPPDFPYNPSGANNNAGPSSSNRNAKADSHHQTASTVSPLLSQFRTRTSTTTQGSSMMEDDEDDRLFARLSQGGMKESYMPPVQSTHPWISAPRQQRLPKATARLQLASYTRPESFITDSVAASTEMELIGSSSFQIRNGFVQPFGDNETKEGNVSVDELFK